MNIDDLTCITKPQAETLKAADWTIDNLAAATIKELTGIKGIGKKTAERITEEARALLNATGLEEARQLAKERYYQKAPAAKIAEDWGEEGLTLENIALASAQALEAVKGIPYERALQVISYAQAELNRLKLEESKMVTFAGGGASKKAVSSAFPEEWLSGEVPPPPMGVRVQRAFDKAKEAYEAANS